MVARWPKNNGNIQDVLRIAAFVSILPLLVAEMMWMKSWNIQGVPSNMATVSF